MRVIKVFFVVAMLSITAQARNAGVLVNAIQDEKGKLIPIKTFCEGQLKTFEKNINAALKKAQKNKNEAEKASNKAILDFQRKELIESTISPSSGKEVIPLMRYCAKQDADYKARFDKLNGDLADQIRVLSVGESEEDQARSAKAKKANDKFLNKSQKSKNNADDNDAESHKKKGSSDKGNKDTSSFKKDSECTADDVVASQDETGKFKRSSARPADLEEFCHAYNTERALKIAKTKCIQMSNGNLKSYSSVCGKIWAKNAKGANPPGGTRIN